MSDEETPEPRSPLDRIQDALADLRDESMCVGFIVIAEWIDEDGDPDLTMLHSRMSAWHMTGMIEHARKWDDSPIIYAVGDFDEDEDPLEG